MEPLLILAQSYCRLRLEGSHSSRFVTVNGMAKSIEIERGVRIRERAGWWHLDARLGDQRLRGGLDTKDPAQAAERARERVWELRQRSKAGLALKPIRFNEAIGAYWDHLLATQPDRDLRPTASNLKMLGLFLDNRETEALSPKLADEYLAWRRAYQRPMMVCRRRDCSRRLPRPRWSSTGTCRPGGRPRQRRRADSAPKPWRGRRLS